MAASVPDNVGPNGVIGETLDGKWWGGYYGWRWPHGFMTIIEPLTIAAMNAALLTGDLGYLEIPRGQLDRLLELGREENGQWRVPYRHTDDGLDLLSPDAAAPRRRRSGICRRTRVTVARLDRIPETRTTWLNVQPGRGKGDDIHFGPWYCYLDGRNPEYPRRILEAQFAEVLRRMDAIAVDHGDPESWDVHHWQDMNPVHTEALVQLTCGGPQIIYHGGLLHVRLRYYDEVERRPGLPRDVAALVSGLDAGSVTVELVNTNPSHSRRLILQAGAFGEHDFGEATRLDDGSVSAINGRYLHVTLPPGRSLGLRLGMRRYCHAPSYAQPI